MHLGRPLDQSAFQKTERCLIEQTLLDLYMNLESSELLARVKRLYWQQYLARLVPDFLVQKAQGRIQTIVEVGCGKGLLANYLSMLLPETQVIGIDADPNNIQIAKETVGGRHNIHFYCGDAFRLSGVKCDQLILTNQFHRMSDHARYRKLLARTLEWLNEDGELFILQKNPGSVFSRQFWAHLASKNESMLILDQWLRNTLRSVGYPVVEDHTIDSRFSAMLTPYLHLRAPLGGRQTTLGAPDHLSQTRQQARAVARQAVRVQPVHEESRDKAVDDALSLIFTNTPKEFAHDL